MRFIPDPSITKQDGSKLDVIEVPFDYKNKSLVMGKYSKYKPEALDHDFLKSLVIEDFIKEPLVFPIGYEGISRSEVLYELPLFRKERVSPYHRYEFVVVNEKVLIDNDTRLPDFNWFRDCDIHFTGTTPMFIPYRFVNCALYGKHSDKNIKPFSSSLYFHLQTVIGGGSRADGAFLKNCTVNDIRFKMTNFEGSAYTVPIEGGALNKCTFEVTTKNIGTGTVTTKQVGHAIALKNVSISKTEFGSIDVFAENCEGIISATRPTKLQGVGNSVIVNNTNGTNPPSVFVGDECTSLQVVNLTKSEMNVMFQNRDYAKDRFAMFTNLYVNGNIRLSAQMTTFATTMREQFDRSGHKQSNAQIVVNTSNTAPDTMGNHDWRLTEEYMGDFFKAKESFSDKTQLHIPDNLLGTFVFSSKRITVNGDNLLGLIITTLSNINDHSEIKLKDDVLNQVILLLHNGMKNEVPKDMDFGTEEGKPIIEKIVLRAFRLYKICHLAKRVL